MPSPQPGRLPGLGVRVRVRVRVRVSLGGFQAWGVRVRVMGEGDG